MGWNYYDGSEPIDMRDVYWMVKNNEPISPRELELKLAIANRREVRSLISQLVAQMKVCLDDDLKLIVVEGTAPQTADEVAQGKAQQKVAEEEVTVERNRKALDTLTSKPLGAEQISEAGYRRGRYNMLLKLRGWARGRKTIEVGRRPASKTTLARTWDQVIQFAQDGMDEMEEAHRG